MIEINTKAAPAKDPKVLVRQAAMTDQIKPLLEKISEICLAEGIPYIAAFSLGAETDDIRPQEGGHSEFGISMLPKIGDLNSIRLQVATAVLLTNRLSEIALAILMIDKAIPGDGDSGDETVSAAAGTTEG